MNLPFFSYISLLVGSCFCFQRTSEYVTLDLDQSTSDDNFDVLNSEHYNLRSKEFYAKEGRKAVRVVQGSLPVWTRAKSEYATKAVLFLDGQPLSLLYLDVHSENSEVYKYFVKVAGVWREVLECVFEILSDVDRTRYSPEQLNKFALDIIETMPKYTGTFALHLPMTFSIGVEPECECQLDVLKPDNLAIMEQKTVGHMFAYSYIPRTFFAMTKVLYGDQLLWQRGSDSLLCASVWRSFKSSFDDLLILNLTNPFTLRTTHKCFLITKDEILETSYEFYLRSLMKMLLKEYDQKDIQSYKNGYLKKEDIAHTLKCLVPMLLVTSAVYYTLF